MATYRRGSFWGLVVGLLAALFVPAFAQAAFTPWYQIVENRLIERLQSEHLPLTSEEKLSLWGAYEKFLTLEYFIQKRHISVTPMPPMEHRSKDQAAYIYLRDVRVFS